MKVDFDGDWGIQQIGALIELRFRDFKDITESNDEWDELTKEWNRLQEFEVFSTKQIRDKLYRLYKEYKEIQLSLDGMEEQEIELPPYWDKMVEFMPLSDQKLSSSNSKKRKTESVKKKNIKKSKIPLLETMDDGLENIAPGKNISSLNTKDTRTIKHDGLEKIATAIENFGNVIKTEAAVYNSRFEDILINQQKLLELALETIGKQLSERIDSGMNQIIDILRMSEGPQE